MRTVRLRDIVASAKQVRLRNYIASARQVRLRDIVASARQAHRLTAVIVWLAILPGGARIVAPLTPTAHAQAPDATDLAEGMRLYLQKGDCQSCHGWAADGRKMDSQMPDGSNLRETRLDRARLIQTIKCGRPGTGMPAFDKFAYSDGRCYGMKKADLKTAMPDPPATFQQREIELVADFLLLKAVGKGPMDRAKCIEYWGSEVEACREFK